MLIRSATPADIPRMLALERQAGTAAHWGEADYRGIFAEGPPERVALVLEEDGVAGFVVARVLGKEWEIENMVVAGGARRRGLGNRLLEELLQTALRRAAAEIRLEVRASNRAARALYEKLAFVESGRRKSYYQDPDEDAVTYKFSFSAGRAKNIEAGHPL